MITQAIIWAALRDLANNDVWRLTDSGAPTNGTSGTGAGLAGPGSEYTDYTNLVRYQNNGTKASPTWVAILDANSVQSLSNKTIAFNAASVAAAGANQGNATAIVTTAPANLLVTGADGTKGVALPAATVGANYFLKNDDAANAILKVYPFTGGTINALGANNSISMAAKTSAVYMCVVAGAWLTIPLLPS